jgi:predicted SprT family Zn-dependent metalloprotease
MTGAALKADLEQAALRAAQRSYQHLNGSLFGARLRPPALELSDSELQLGRWISSRRTLELSRQLLWDHGWSVLEEVLKHEMAHQYVDEVLGVRDQAAHGPVFRKVCEERAIDARASGAPQAQAAHNPILDRIAKLLSLAQSTSEHEAQAAMSAAQRLMLKHNIESIAGAAHGAHCFRRLGKPSGRVPEHERRLALILDQHFFVQVIWVPVWRVTEGKRGSVLEVCGTRENTELAAYVYDFLLHAAHSLYDQDRARRADRTHASRRKFLAGVMAGFQQRLERERRRAQAEGLIWVGDPALNGYFRKRHPHVRWARHQVSTGGEDYARGHTAGQKIVLHRGVAAHASGTLRFLPAGGGD